MTLDYEVLIPAYNAAERIGSTISSAANQIHPPSAIRVYVDGGVGVAETEKNAFSAGATHVMVAEENRGVGYARQRLLSQAQADWVVFLDADDQLLSNASGVWSLSVNDHPQAAVIAFDWRVQGSSHQSGPLDASSLHLREYSQEEIWKRNPITSSAALIRRHVLDEVGGYDETARRLVDYHVWLKMATSGFRIHVGTLPIVTRHVDPSTITGDVNRAVERELILVSRHVPPATTMRRLRMREIECWLRGLARHLDYGKDPRSYISARAVLVQQYRVAFALDSLRIRWVCSQFRVIRRGLNGLRKLRGAL